MRDLACIFQNFCQQKDIRITSINFESEKTLERKRNGEIGATDSSVFG